MKFKKIKIKKFLSFITSRLFVRSLIILLQLLFLLVITYFLSSYSIYIEAFLTLCSIIMVFTIINDDSNPTFKVSWLIPILIFPILGWLFYFIFERRHASSKTQKSFNSIMDSSTKFIKQDSEIIKEIHDIPGSLFRQSQYILNTSNMCIFKNTQTHFFPTGESFFKAYLHELNLAKKFIFIEYFIIGEGKMWNEVLAILKRKATQGVEVRVMYDDIGTITILDKNYSKTLEKFGIKTAIFNPFTTSLDTFFNYRDHRKITVIDGNLAFTGGLNLSDEYINQKIRFGYWKDCAILLKGDAVSSMTLMFLQLWNFSLQKQEIENCKPYLSTKSFKSDGYVQPFGDGPMSGYLIGENAYMGIINNAKKYVYITTPYLILDNEMMSAIIQAAKSNVDVRIITPHIPDKWYVHSVTRSNYTTLIKNGVKIYEYTPGFIHAKTILSDDKYCIVGTTNFDFRSFYLHFENGVFMYKTKAVMEVKDDYIETMKKTIRITKQDCENVPLIKRFVRSILKLFSPMM